MLNNVNFSRSTLGEAHCHAPSNSYYPIATPSFVPLADMTLEVPRGMLRVVKFLKRSESFAVQSHPYLYMYSDPETIMWHDKENMVTNNI